MINTWGLCYDFNLFQNVIKFCTNEFLNDEQKQTFIKGCN